MKKTKTKTKTTHLLYLQKCYFSKSIYYPELDYIKCYQNSIFGHFFKNYYLHHVPLNISEPEVLPRTQGFPEHVLGNIVQES